MESIYPVANESLDWYSLSGDDSSSLVEFADKYPEFNHMQDSYRLRFLRARKYNLDTAATMLRAHVEYKEKARPDEFIIEPGTVRLNEHSEPLPDSAQMSEMALSGWARLLGVSSAGNPVLYVTLDKFVPIPATDLVADINENYKIVFGWLMASVERTCRLHRSTMIIPIIDLGNYGTGLFGLRESLGVCVKLAQDQHPDRMKTLIMLNAPWVFRAAWTFIKLFLDADAAAKAHFVSGEENIANLLREVGISAEITLVEHGGLIRSLDDVPVPNFPPEPEPERAAPEDSLQHAEPEPEPEPETETEPVPVPVPVPVPDEEKWRISVDGSNVQFIAGADSEVQPALDVSDDPRGSRCC